jgi:hypothetical protein
MWEVQMVIEGAQDVMLTIRFRCPPNTPPADVAASIARQGVTISLGLLEYVKEASCDVVPWRDVTQEDDGKPKLVL